MMSSSCSGGGAFNEGQYGDYSEAECCHLPEIPGCRLLFDTAFRFRSELALCGHLVLKHCHWIRSGRSSGLRRGRFLTASGGRHEDKDDGTDYSFHHVWFVNSRRMESFQGAGILSGGSTYGCEPA